MWPSVVGQVQFLRGSARVHASTGRHAGKDLAFERHLAGVERSPLSPPQTSSGLSESADAPARRGAWCTSTRAGADSLDLTRSTMASSSSSKSERNLVWMF